MSGSAFVFFYRAQHDALKGGQKLTARNVGRRVDGRGQGKTVNAVRGGFFVVGRRSGGCQSSRVLCSGGAAQSTPMKKNSQGPEDRVGDGRADEAEEHRADKLADERDRELARAHALVVGLGVGKRGGEGAAVVRSVARRAGGFGTRPPPLEGGERVARAEQVDVVTTYELRVCSRLSVCKAWFFAWGEREGAG